MSAGANAMLVAIRVHSASRLLEIEWADETRSTLTHAELRYHCKCANCEQRRRTGLAPSLQDDVSITEVNPIGPAALRLHFSDGHSRGIFPFEYLRQLSQLAR